jgi:hypothetical protein
MQFAMDASEPGGEQGHQNRGGQRESEPGSDSAADSGAREPDQEADLAASGTRQELGESEEVGERVFVDPSAALDEIAVEVADVRRGSAETGEPEFQADREDLQP